MRFLMPLVSAIVVMAVLFQSGPRQAFACSCAPLPDSPARAREIMDYPSVSAVVLGVVEERLNGENDPYPAARVRIERAYKGGSAPEVTVTSDNCNGIIVDFRKGERWLMTLSERDGGWQAHGCSAGLVDGVMNRARYNDGDVWLAALNEIMPPPDDEARPASAAAIAESDRGGASGIAVGLTVAGLAVIAFASAYASRRRLPL